MGDEKKLFNCSQCGLETKSKSYLKRHVIAAHEGVRFPCDKCKYLALYEHDLALHRKAKHLKSTIFCTFQNCDYKTSVERNLRNHIAFKHEGIVYPCDLCEFKGANTNSLKQHNLSIHENKKYFCNECDYFGTQSGAVIKHRKRVHLGIDFKCTSCDFVTKDKISLKKHLDSQHLLPCKYKCDLCNYKTNIKQNLKLHDKSKHNDSQYVCNICEKLFPVLDYLRRHKELMHVKAESFKCGQCNFKTKTNQRLKNHMNAVHDKIKYQCNLCSYKTGWYSHMGRHVKMNHENKTLRYYSCSQCEYRGNAEERLRYHKKTRHSDKLYPCPSCHKEYSDPQTLRKHERSVHKVSELIKMEKIETKLQAAIEGKNINMELEIECNVCFKMYKNESKLKEHKRKTHKGETLCDLCQAKFKSITALRIHKKSKHEGVRYDCHLCDHKATQKGDLKKHISRHSNRQFLSKHARSVHKVELIKMENIKTKLKSVI